MTSPLKKRAKSLQMQIEERPDPTPNGTTTTATGGIVTLEAVHAHFDILMKPVENRTSSNAKNANAAKIKTKRQSLLQLAEYQRHLYEVIQRQQKQIQKMQTAYYDERYANKYEQAFLQQQIQTVRQSLQNSPFLEQLVRQEATTDSNASQTELLQRFFQVDVYDPQQKDTVLEKLQESLQQRQRLAQQVMATRKTLLDLQTQLKHRKDFLKALPTHLSTIERSTKLLADAMAKQHAMTTLSSSVGKKTNHTAVQQMSGPARKERLIMATQLPTPLYSIFASFQNGLDQIICNTNNNNNSTKQPLHPQQIRLYAIIGVPEEDNNIHHNHPSTTTSEVVLDIPVPQVLTKENKYKKHPVKIHFGYFETPTPRVVVYADSAMMATDLYHPDGLLLQELFPDDIGEEYVLSTTTIQREHPKLMSFVWCNHLAGLYPVVETSSTSSTSSSSSYGWLSSRTPSAKIVLQQLQKRIRASATLNHILHALCRLQFPRIPQADTNITPATNTPPVSNTTTCKLISCTPIADHDSCAPTNIVRYGLVLRKGTQSISATVEIHRVCYPAVPPVWEIYTTPPTITSSSANVSHLYDDRLAKLQHDINHELLLVPTAKRTTSQHSESKYYYHEWILAHQLYRVVQYLEESTTASTFIGTTETMAGRQCRGRDRQPI